MLLSLNFWLKKLWTLRKIGRIVFKYQIIFLLELPVFFYFTFVCIFFPFLCFLIWFYRHDNFTHKFFSMHLLKTKTFSYITMIMLSPPIKLILATILSNIYYMFRFLQLSSNYPVWLCFCFCCLDLRSNQRSLITFGLYFSLVALM